MKIISKKILILSFLAVLVIGISACDMNDIDTGIEIVEIQSLDSEDVAYGTSFDEIDLPGEIEVTLDDNSTALLEVNWKEGDYDGNQPGNYTIIGELELTENITNPDNLTPVIDVEVHKLETDTAFFEVVELDIPEEIKLGETEYLEAEVKNIGDIEGVQDIVAKIYLEEDVFLEDKEEDVSLEPGESWIFSDEVEIPDEEFLADLEWRLELITEDHKKIAYFISKKQKNSKETSSSGTFEFDDTPGDSKFIKSATVTENNNANCYRLPTKEKHEFAARGGIVGKSTIFAGSNNFDEVGWYWENSHQANSPQRPDGRGTMKIGLKQANEFGLYDMSGNVDDWTNSQTEIGSARVRRGRSWRTGKDYCELDDYMNSKPSLPFDSAGFRIARNIQEILTERNYNELYDYLSCKNYAEEET